MPKPIDLFAPLPVSTYWCRIEQHVLCGGTCTHMDRAPTPCGCPCHTERNAA